MDRRTKEQWVSEFKKGSAIDGAITDMSRGTNDRVKVGPKDGRIDCTPSNVRKEAIEELPE